MKFDIDSFREIGDSLLRNKRRTLLTGFGVFWGLFMLLFMMGGGRGIKALLEKNFEGFATNTVVMISTNTSKPYKGLPEGRYWNFNYDDLDYIKMMVPELDVVTPQISNWGVSLSRDQYSSSGHVKGIEADYCKIEEPKMKYGRFLNDVDVRQERKVCIIGKRIYTSLFPEGGDPCGEFIQIGSVWLQVIGVDYNSSSININGNSDQQVTVPITLASKLYQRGKNVDIICVSVKPGVKMTSLEHRIRSVVAHRKQFDPTDDEALMLLNTEQIFQIVDNLFRGLNFLIWLVGLGTLLAGAIGVSNIMLVTVKERTVEIGIRRAIGALPGEILTQILSESIALTLAAGSAGIVFSVLLLSLLEKVSSEGGQFLISFWTAVIAALLLAALGAVAGLAPAMRAMKIKPVDAMRDE